MVRNCLMSNYPFPLAETERITNEALVGALKTLEQQGWKIRVESAMDNKHCYSILMGNGKKISVLESNTDSSWTVLPWGLGGRKLARDFSNIMDLQQTLFDVAREVHGFSGSVRQNVAVACSGQPITNTQKLIDLIGDSSVVTFYDPYLWDKSVFLLTRIFRVGGIKIDPNIKLLTSQKSEKNSKLTLETIQDFYEEIGGTQPDVRVFPDSTEGHFGRVLALSNDESIYMSGSANNMGFEGMISRDVPPELLSIVKAKLNKSRPYVFSK